MTKLALGLADKQFEPALGSIRVRTLPGAIAAFQRRHIPVKRRIATQEFAFVRLDSLAQIGEHAVYCVLFSRCIVKSR